MIGLTPFLHEPEHETDVDADATLEVAVEADVAREGIPVAVEGQTYEFTLTIEHWASAVATRDVVGGEETEGQLTALLVGIATVVVRLQ